jgi:hypothetical protein
MKWLFRLVAPIIMIQMIGCRTFYSGLNDSSLYRGLRFIDNQLTGYDTSTSMQNIIIAAGYPVRHIKSGNDSVTVLALGKAEYDPGKHSSTYSTQSYVPSGSGGGHWTTTIHTTSEIPASVSIEPTKTFFIYSSRLPILKKFNLLPPKMVPCFYCFAGALSPFSLEYNDKNIRIVSPCTQQGNKVQNSTECEVMIKLPSTKGFDLPELPAHLKNLSLSPALIINDYYSLGRPSAQVPFNLRLSIDVRKSIKLYTILSSGYSGNNDYLSKTEAARMLAWLKAWDLTVKAKNYFSGESTPFFCAIDSRNILFKKRTQRAYELYLNAADCDSNWHYSLKKASEMQHCLSDNSNNCFGNTVSTKWSRRRWRIGTIMRLSGLMTADRSNEAQQSKGLYLFALSGAYLLSNDLSLEMNWSPFNFISMTTNNGELYDIFNGARGGFGFRYQVPVRLQFWNLGTRLCISSKLCIDKHSFKLAGVYGTDSTSSEFYGQKAKGTAFCGDVGIGFIIRESIFKPSFPYGAVEGGYRFGRYTGFTTMFHGRETALRSAYDGKKIGFDPSGWFITIILLL